jgi:hypothetical protein
MDPVTKASSIVLPFEDVALAHLKDSAGNPVVVRVEARGAMTTYDALKALPGARFVAPEAEGAARDPAVQEAVVRQNLRDAEPLIEACTLLRDENGGEVIPAFWFDPAKARSPLSVPGRMLHDSDKALLLNAILRVSGLAGGEADAVAFPAGTGSGVDGAGTVVGGPSTGEGPA